MGKKKEELIKKLREYQMAFQKIMETQEELEDMHNGELDGYTFIEGLIWYQADENFTEIEGAIKKLQN